MERRMNRRHFMVSALGSAAGLCTASDVVGQKKTLAPDLFRLAKGKGLTVFNRTVSGSKKAAGAAPA